MRTEKLHYLIALIAYLVNILHFIFTDYTQELFTSGVIFFTFAFLIYIIFVYIFFKVKNGKFIVFIGLFIIATSCVFLAHIN